MEYNTNEKIQVRKHTIQMRNNTKNITVFKELSNNEVFVVEDTLK